jgi:hypothetical protein
MTTFIEKLKDAMGPRGYESCMRRSVQTVVLYEAYRCISDRLSSLRPFQRKLAFYDQSLALVDAIGLLPHQKGEIMWRTGTSREPMQPETAWKRMKLIEKEVEKIKERIKPFVAEGRSQKETCDMFVQKQYVSGSGHIFILASHLSIARNCSYSQLFRFVFVFPQAGRHFWFKRQAPSTSVGACAQQCDHGLSYVFQRWGARS